MSNADVGAGNAALDVAAGMGAGNTEQHETNRIARDPVDKWDAWWTWLGEKSNPIVVKEIRQSLKSRQFSISFGLTLIAAVVWTLIAVSLMVPRIYYVPGGLPLLTGFFCILTLPLMVIIPFSAFRSLTSETEDGTFELLSISALSATQIIYGKMASASVQVVLYLSALAPCIVMTYLLRGVGMFAILLILGVTVLFSIAETAAALCLASISRSRMVQNGVSVLVLAGLILGFFVWASSIIGILGSGEAELSNPPKEVFLVMFGVLTVVALLISLVLRAASAAIDFASENSSTPIRMRLFMLVALMLFWTVLGAVAAQNLGVLFPWLVCLFVLMMFVGALVCGELGVISPRAQRTLPETFLGRIFKTFLYPGAGLGYIFIVCLFAACAATCSGLELVFSASMENFVGKFSVAFAGYFLTCYLAVYLGVNRLFMLMLPKDLAGRMIGAFALLAVMLLMVHLVPLFLVYYMNDYRDPEYGIHQTFNIFWTVGLIGDRQIDSVSGGPLVLLTLSAIMVFGLNLAMCTRDVMLVRVGMPPRIADDEQGEPVQAAAPDPFAD